MTSLPEEFVERLQRRIDTPERREWLRQLPDLVQELLEEWELEPEGLFELSFNYVVAVRQANGAAGVLKLGLPDPDGVREAAALRAYDGDGACRVIESDDDRRAMLLERIHPGDMLVEVARTNDEAATRTGAEVMRRLWRHTPEDATSHFRPLAQWFQAFERHRTRFHGTSGPVPDALLVLAEQIAPELLSSAPQELLLHADFHHFNVLRSDRAGWLAIDPKGMYGDPGYEAGPFMCNPGLVATDVLRRRLDILSEVLEYDRERLRLWCIAYAVLSVCWSIEDSSSSWRTTLHTAQQLVELR
jgi:streptomycin 6-kinase